MTNPTTELNSLRDRLLSNAKQENGFIGKSLKDLDVLLSRSKKSRDRIYEIVYSAEQELNMAILDIVTDSLQQAQQLAVEYGVEKFAEQVHIDVIGDSFKIAVMDGKTDYSTPAVELAPKMLLNGKTSKDGVVYKVIPLPTVRGHKTRSLSSIDALQSRASEIKQQKAQRKEALDAARMARNLATTAPRAKIHTEEIPPVGKEFRTVTNKQDKSTMWVKPAKDIDLTYELMDINERMTIRIRNATTSIISRYK